MKLHTFILLLCVSAMLLLSCIQEQVSESQVIEKSIFSNHLQESRAYTVYLPKGYKKNERLPIVITTDGQTIVEYYRKHLDSLITNNAAPKFILVGVHSNEKQVEGSELQYRNYEYIKDFGEGTDSTLNQLFYKHMKFFTQELIPSVKDAYTRDNSHELTFYGTSNGAGFGVTLSFIHPSLFKNYILFSMAGGSYENPYPAKGHPRLVLAYGDKEPIPLTMQIDEFSLFLTHNDIDHTYYTYNGGHTRKDWRSEFLSQLPRLLNTREN